MNRSTGVCSWALVADKSRTMGVKLWQLEDTAGCQECGVHTVGWVLQ